MLKELRDKESKCRSWAARLGFTSIKCDELDKAYTSDLLTNYLFAFVNVETILLEDDPSLDDHKKLTNIKNKFKKQYEQNVNTEYQKYLNNKK